jgi:hypothetical protein
MNIMLIDGFEKLLRKVKKKNDKKNFQDSLHIFVDSLLRCCVDLSAFLNLSRSFEQQVKIFP